MYKFLRENYCSELGNYTYSTYLIGAMSETSEGDMGEKKRQGIHEELKKRSVFPIDPCISEEFRTGLTSEDMQDKMNGWVASGNWEKYKRASDSIWKGQELYFDNGATISVPGDFHYVKTSDWITAFYSNGDKPVGTYGEAGLAYYFNIPIYLISSVAKRDLPGSFLCFIVGSNGEVFRSKSEYLDFIEDKYSLKIRTTYAKKS